MFKTLRSKSLDYLFNRIIRNPDMVAGINKAFRHDHGFFPVISEYDMLVNTALYPLDKPYVKLGKQLYICGSYTIKNLHIRNAWYLGFTVQHIGGYSVDFEFPYLMGYVNNGLA